jgi:hypothetical protein
MRLISTASPATCTAAGEFVRDQQRSSRRRETSAEPDKTRAAVRPACDGALLYGKPTLRGRISKRISVWLLCVARNSFAVGGNAGAFTGERPALYGGAGASAGSRTCTMTSANARRSCARGARRRPYVAFVIWKPSMCTSSRWLARIAEQSSNYRHLCADRAFTASLENYLVAIVTKCWLAYSVWLHFNSRGIEVRFSGPPNDVHSEQTVAAFKKAFCLEEQRARTFPRRWRSGADRGHDVPRRQTAVFTRYQ